MPLAIGQAVLVAGLFRKAEYDDEGVFHKSRLKRLSQADRKICYKALSWLERVKLSDWTHEPKRKLEEMAIQNLSQNIDKDLVEIGEKKVVWYVAPLIWLAKKIYSFWLGCLNLLGLRVSTKMLETKIRRHRGQYASGQERYHEVTKENGLLEIKKKDLQDKLNARNQIAVTRLGEIKDVLKALKHLECLDDNEMLSREASLQWNIPEYEESRLPMDSFKTIVNNFFNNNVIFKDKLPDLLTVASADGSSDDEIRTSLMKCHKDAQAQLAALKLEANVANAALNKAFNEEKTLSNEVKLLSNKFNFS